jgi:hypothetical protein
MKDAEIKAQALLVAEQQLAALNTAAAAQIVRIQDRVETLGYGIEAGKATEAEFAEAASFAITLKAWKNYKYQLGKVTAQPNWHQQPTWPDQPATPNIEASDALARAA